MGVSKSKDISALEQNLQAQFNGQQQQQMFQPNSMPNFGMPMFPAQALPPQLQQQLNQQMANQMNQQPVQAMSPTFGQSGNSQMSSFPPFPAMPAQMSMGGMQFPNLPSLPGGNAIYPSNTSSAFPVSFPNQPVKMISGYAPPPDRRGHMMNQQPHEHEQGEFSARGGYYVEQQVMPQHMQNMQPPKSRKQQQQQHQPHQQQQKQHMN